MKTIRDAVHCLKELASEMEVMQTSLTIVDDRLALGEACQRLRATLGPEGNFAIRLEISGYSSGNLTAGWEVYDGKEFYKAATLEQAVSDALAKHRPVPSIEAVEIIERAEVLLHKQASAQLPF